MLKYVSQILHASILPSMSSKATTAPLWVLLMTKIVTRSRSTWMHATSVKSFSAGLSLRLKLIASDS